MTKYLEEEFDLPPTFEHDDDEDDNAVSQITVEEAETQASKLISALSSVEKIDYALATVNDLESYNGEMDDIAEKALDGYKDMLLLGMNAPLGNAARLLEVANMMLRTALDARSNKAANKLKTVELQIRKARLDQEVGAVESSGPALDHRAIVDLVKNAAIGQIEDGTKNPNSDK